MREFTLFTDVNTDVHPEYAKDEGIVILPQYYYFEGDDVVYGDEILLDEETFYKRLADGETAKSSGVNPDRARRTFEEELKKGKDILAIICSSGLSMSYQTCHNVGQELMQEYPGSKIIVMDSLNESGGAGLMLYVARDMQKEGRTMEEIRDYIESIKQDFQGMFVVDDLKYLVRGGRLNPFSGAFGTLLDIKPILYLNEEGKIVPLKKVRTRKRAVNEILRIAREMQPDPKYMYVVYTYNRDDAEELADRVEAELGIKVNRKYNVAMINNTIGAHTGPNALGFGFLAHKKWSDVNV
ncbi:MAG: DegV family protein [Eubacterium sp.]|nr:DegV family protein [Eubacterium sp.]